MGAPDRGSTTVVAYDRGPTVPYLFLLVADVLQQLIKLNPDVYHPIVDNAQCPVLQYANDTLILLRADLDSVRHLRQALDSFSIAMSLCINVTPGFRNKPNVHRMCAQDHFSHIQSTSSVNIKRQCKQKRYKRH